VAPYDEQTALRDTAEMRTRRPSRVKGLHVMGVKLSETWLKKQGPPETGPATFWDGDHKEAIKGFGVRILRQRNDIHSGRDPSSSIIEWTVVRGA
jgi:hypothetical protein